MKQKASREEKVGSKIGSKSGFQKWAPKVGSKEQVSLITPSTSVSERCGDGVPAIRIELEPPGGLRVGSGALWSCLVATDLQVMGLLSERYEKNVRAIFEDTPRVVLPPMVQQHL